MNCPKEIRSAYHIVRNIWIRYQYHATLSCLRKDYGKRKMKVGFLVSELAKWKGQSLYDLMDGSSNFDPQIIVYPMQVEMRDSRPLQEATMKIKADYFRNKRMALQNLWDIEKQRFKLEGMNDIDICFYQQPWDLPPAPYPRQIAAKMLTFYFPYYVGSYKNTQMNTVLSREVFRQILLNEEQKSKYNKNRSYWKYSGLLIGLGYPVLDYLNIRKDTDPTSQSVIYAPHFSFPVEGCKRLFPASTFLDNGRLILNFAKSHPEIKWAFKPHPRLRRELTDTHTWTKEEVDEYYGEWEKIGTVCYTSDYVSLFQNYSVMITDCGSFLTEYSCTGKPIIHLVPGKLPSEPDPAVAELFNFFYQASCVSDLERLLDQIVIKREDPMKSARLECMMRIGLLDSNASQNIMNYLDQLLG